MKQQTFVIGLVTIVLLSAASAFGQIDDICREFGAVPSLDAPKLQAPFVYGKITVKGVTPGTKPPRITITYSDANQPSVRQSLNGSGNYCFKRTGGDGVLVLEVAGTEYARKTIPGFGQPQQREDFEISADRSPTSVPNVVSARFPYDRNDKNTELFVKAAEAEKMKDRPAAIGFIKEVVAADPADFIAWAKLGSLYFEQNAFSEAEASFKKALELKVDYTPAWIYMGRIRTTQKQYEIAIEIFKQAIATDVNSARSYQLLGDTYLQLKRGTLGAEALNKAIELDPNGMADSHLTLALLYDRAGAKHLASKEYKAYITKRPDYPDKAKLENYIKENPLQ